MDKFLFRRGKIPPMSRRTHRNAQALRRCRRASRESWSTPPIATNDSPRIQRNILLPANAAIQPPTASVFGSLHARGSRSGDSEKWREFTKSTFGTNHEYVLALQKMVRNRPCQSREKRAWSDNAYVSSNRFCRLFEMTKNKKAHHTSQKRCKNTYTGST